jgi:hypothetical protein
MIASARIARRNVERPSGAGVPQSLREWRR